MPTTNSLAARVRRSATDRAVLAARHDATQYLSGLPRRFWPESLLPGALGIDDHTLDSLSPEPSERDAVASAYLSAYRATVESWIVEVPEDGAPIAVSIPATGRCTLVSSHCVMGTCEHRATEAA